MNDFLAFLRWTGMGRGCVKTLAECSGEKLGLIERPTSDDRHLGNGFATPKILVSQREFEFLHNLGTQQSATNDRIPAGSFRN